MTEDQVERIKSRKGYCKTLRHTCSLSKAEMVSTISGQCFGIFYTICTSSFFLIAFAKPMKDDFRPQADLVCYECTRTSDNDTCALNLELIPEVTAHGQDFRCRVYEMDGTVVARGIVPSNLCTPEAFVKINLNVAQFAKTMNASGPVHASCCNKDKCNVDFCTSEGRTADCSTLVSVLNGDLAAFVDGDQVKQRMEIRNKLVVENGNETFVQQEFGVIQDSASGSSSSSNTTTSGNNSSSFQTYSVGNNSSPSLEFEFYNSNSSTGNHQKSASLQYNGTNIPDLGQLTQRSSAFVKLGNFQLILMTFFTSKVFFG